MMATTIGLLYTTATEPISAYGAATLMRLQRTVEIPEYIYE
jgi:hypothetical protein